jgi:competence protein ComEA
MNLLKALLCSLAFVGVVNAAEPAAPELININTADIATLATLTGISSKKAKDIIDYRQANKGFKTVDELANVHGIGKKTLETNRARLTVGDVKVLVNPVDSKDISKSEPKPMIDNKSSAPSTANGLMPKM